MTDEINVLSRTQIINVDPVTNSVSIINAGPPGPPGSSGGESVWEVDDDDDLHLIENPATTHVYSGSFDIDALSSYMYLRSLAANIGIFAKTGIAIVTDEGVAILEGDNVLLDADNQVTLRVDATNDNIIKVVSPGAGGPEIDIISNGQIALSAPRIIVNDRRVPFTQNAFDDTYSNTGTTETLLTSSYLPVLVREGDSFDVTICGVFSGHATALQRLKFEFAGGVVLDTGAVAVPSSSKWIFRGTGMRHSNSVMTYQCELVSDGTPQSHYINVSNISSLNMNAVNYDYACKATASGTGAGSNQTFHTQTRVLYHPFSY